MREGIDEWSDYFVKKVGKQIPAAETKDGTDSDSDKDPDKTPIPDTEALKDVCNAIADVQNQLNDFNVQLKAVKDLQNDIERADKKRGGGGGQEPRAGQGQLQVQRRDLPALPALPKDSPPRQREGES